MVKYLVNLLLLDYLSSILANYIFFHILQKFKFIPRQTKHLIIQLIIHPNLQFTLNYSNSKQNQMNFETYKNYTESLEKEINSRQQQRIKMAANIDSLNIQLEQNIQKNKSIKEELNRNVKNNQSFLLELHAREQIIQEQKSQINNQQTSDEFNKQKIILLQQQKNNFQDELKQRDSIIKQNNLMLRDLQVEMKKNMRLVEEYKNIINQKAKEMAKLQSIASKFQFQKENLCKQMQDLKQLFEKKRQYMQSQIEHPNTTEELTAQKYQKRITKLLQQLTQCKQLHKNQLKTLQFNHQQQVQQLTAQIAKLKKEILQSNEEMEQVRAEDKELKRQFQAQTTNKDEIVNELINEINFIRTQKIQIENINQLKIQEFTQEILNVKMQKAVQNQKIHKLLEKITQKDQKMLILTRQIQALEQDNKKYQREFLQEKDISFQRGEELFQFKEQIQKLTSKLQTVMNQKHSLFNSTSQQLNFLRQQNIDLQSSLITARSSLQQQTIAQIQLKQKIKQLTYECNSISRNKNQLLQLINNQKTIKNLQALLQQSKKVIQELSVMMKSRLEQIDVLEESNRMLRTQKLNWLKMEEKYRKKIIELRNTRGSKKSITPNFSTATLRTLQRAHTEFAHFKTLNVLNSPQTQSNVYLHFASTINDLQKRKKITSIHIPQRFHTQNHSEATDKNINSSSNQDLNLSIPQIEDLMKDNRLNHQTIKSLKIKELEVNSVAMNQLLKKKQKILQLAGENGESKSRLKKDYSVGMINSVSNKEFSFYE